MHKHSTYSLILSALLTLPWLSACVSEDMEPCPTEVADTSTGYLRLSVSTTGDAGSRANPEAGEWGDGPEHGRGNENIIHNLSLFLYRDGGEGLDGEYRVLWTKYVDAATVANANPDHPLDHIYTVSIPLPEADFNIFSLSENYTLRVLAVANAGDLTATLGGLTINRICRDLEYGAAWKDDEIPADCDYFVLSSAFNGAKRTATHTLDGKITFTKSEAQGRVFSGEVTLERVAARIDLRFNEENIQDNTIRYYAGGTENYLTLLNAIPVNQMQQRSYLVKQVTDNPSDRYEWQSAADETVSGGIPANYVLSPAFSKKATKDEDLTGWYGNSRASWLRTADKNALATLSPMSTEVVGTTYTLEDDADYNRAIILTYANENTHPEDLQLTPTDAAAGYHPSDYLTGLLFRTQYHPAILHTDGNLDGEIREYKDGEDFWLFRTVASEVKEKSNLYFASRKALEEYVATLPAGVRDKYETLHYPGGICYYNIWIKHANNGADPEQNYPMKYGIVRNNIYRVALNFQGIGQPTPEIREPYAVTSRIYVIKWNFRPQPEIIM
ncbi:MAG: Mfa1 family fimbria major subunit [Muribaculaceae bacterium]|nr:Mfa1 family fimbria major subunit [Muribaculaceae bacterium]